jgi:hypothetical protein
MSIRHRESLGGGAEHYRWCASSHGQPRLAWDALYASLRLGRAEARPYNGGAVAGRAQAGIYIDHRDLGIMASWLAMQSQR